MLPQYIHVTSFFGGAPPLSQSVGFAIVLGFGAFFSVFTTAVVCLNRRFNGIEQTSEQFNTAGRSVKTGLTAAVIVAQWTWAATLLQSSNVAWTYGVSGAYWYAAGASIQCVLFGVLAIEIKRKAPTAHTVCEMVRARWGTRAHITFLFFCLLANIIVTSMLLLGGAATVHALTGMDINLAAFLIPWGVILYSAVGGLHAKFIADYVYVAVIFVILVVCIYTVYVTESSTNEVYEGLQTVKSYTEAQCSSIFSDANGTSFFKAGQYACGSIEGNQEGSYLTMLSEGGLAFGVINIIGNFGTVFCDQSYWQSAIAAKPTSAHKGYLLGGVAWFAIPFSLATSLGLCAASLQLPITAAEASAGLVPPAVATHLFGKAGSVMMTIMLFNAITSTGSAEGLAVSSLVVYDIYKPYINPKASGRQILLLSKVVIVLFGGSMGALAVGLNFLGLDLGFVYLFMGILIGSAVIPLWNMLMWPKANATGAVAAAWGGMGLALLTWLAVASAKYGELTLKTLGKNEPMLLGNLVAIGSSGLIHFAFSMVRPQNYDFESMREIELLDGDSALEPAADESEAHLEEAKAWIVRRGFGFSAVVIVFWPLLCVAAGVFSKVFFTLWVFISLVWGFSAAAVIIILPIHESREALLEFFRPAWCGTAAAKAKAAAEKEKVTTGHTPPQLWGASMAASI
ncbi:unnamed protein product [Polarella glacialis]|uniref:Urea transporter n=1 Tax=Polarella glacialis TaxID=89957 RepID=A0A813GG98_POLGL|nr:unnamed protein product [Polarella glacialis]CAE8678794.1 unnamed protein product [Polarella glacialis]